MATDLEEPSLQHVCRPQPLARRHGVEGRVDGKRPAAVERVVQVEISPNRIAIHLDSLRQSDVELVQIFIRRYSLAAGKSISAISDDALERLRSYSWPGNIRQLENAIEQAVVLSKNPVLTLDDLPQEVREDLPPPYDNADDGQLLFSDMPSLEEIKKRYALYVMRRTRGNVSRAACRGRFRLETLSPSSWPGLSRPSRLGCIVLTSARCAGQARA